MQLLRCLCAIFWAAAGLVGLLVPAISYARDAVASAGNGFVQKSEGPLSATLFIVDDVSRFVSELRGHASSAPNVKVATRALRGQMLTAIIEIARCTVKSDGRCNVSADFVVQDPTGRILLSQPRLPLWQTPPVVGAAALSELSLSIRLQGDALLGLYSISSRIRDEATGAEVSCTATFEVADGPQFLRNPARN